ncbi:MAG: GNAT family N-acetyltransferase, partial [Candidatus Stahlbacteria bacterium]|nr:GNAT family N-acetyltransferase [Candidatus Stahlbacteria bacterium]
FALGIERGKGYSRTALELLISDLFKKGTHRIEAEVYDYNITSKRVLQSLGFKKEGIKRKSHYYRTKYYDIFCYGIIEDDWKLLQ